MTHSAAPSRRGILELVALYAAEGLPYGFIAQGLPAVARIEGKSLKDIGFLGLVFLPWALKFLWAPVVDNVALPGLGRRKSWIILTQLSIIAMFSAAALLVGERSITALIPLVVAINVMSATQDIAVDGYAVSKLTHDTRGLGNAIQVCGYKLGSVLSGGLLLYVADHHGWSTALWGMVLLLAAVTPVTFTIREIPDEKPAKPAANATWETVLATGKQLVAAPRAWMFLVFILLVKTGEAAAGGMIKPVLVDGGFSLTEIAEWDATLGMTVSLVGSGLGGVLVTRVPRRVALGISVALQAVGILLLVPVVGAPKNVLGIAIVLEHFVTGVLTTVLFTVMMDVVDPRHGGTQYSLLASIVVVGTGAGRTLSGIIAEAIGYQQLFVGAAVMTLLCLPLMAASWPGSGTAGTSRTSGT